jgi:hypothetical protein
MDAPGAGCTRPGPVDGTRPCTLPDIITMDAPGEGCSRPGPVTTPGWCPPAVVAFAAGCEPGGAGTDGRLPVPCPPLGLQGLAGLMVADPCGGKGGPGTVPPFTLDPALARGAA